MAEVETLSRWWCRSVIITIVVGFTVLALLAFRTYQDAPPVPKNVVGPSGEIIFTGVDIGKGQQVFLKYGLMENGSIWGHGAYIGPDFSAEYLHVLATEARAVSAQQQYPALKLAALTPAETVTVDQDVARLLKHNRYDPRTGILVMTNAEVATFGRELVQWARYFSTPESDGGLPRNYIADSTEMRDLTAFFAWTAWASVVDRPGKSYSYTNNFPYDLAAGNTPTSGAYLWSALSLITLLGGIAAILFAFGRFDFLGWRRRGEHVHPHMLPGETTASQRATIRYFVVVALLFLVQTLVGGGIAHYRADASSFYGLDLTRLFGSQILRTWHLQLAIFWVTTSYVAGGLFLAPSIGRYEPAGQVRWVNLLFFTMVAVIVGSLLGEFLGVRQLMGRLWVWFGDQGWEYLDLGRAWQILLALGLAMWVVLLFRAIRPALKDPERGELASLFLWAAIAIPVFYAPAFFYKSNSNFAVVDLWRFWIIHLWVENFLELYVTAAVAIVFYELGLVSHVTAARVVYLDALLYLGSGIIGTGHHWYFTGQSELTMALAAVFSAMEVVPLTLLTLDAWDFIQLSRGRCGVCGKEIIVPHRWTFYFLMAVGFWNFVGAGIFGFLINLPIVSYFEAGTMLTANHAHAAMMGVFGMLAVALMVFAFRQVTPEEDWERTVGYLRVSFWGLNIGLAWMVVTSLFPGGVLQLYDVLQNGYWHARSVGFREHGLAWLLEWLRLPGDAVFILFGVVPLVIAALKTYLGLLRRPARAIAPARGVTGEAA